jgi:uncharacterized membrane protein YgcG
MPAQDHSHHGHGAPPQGGFWTSRAFIVFLGFAAIALVLLWEEHKAHILGLIPYLFLLACPLMHIFMHGGHGGHAGHNSSSTDTGETSSGSSGTWDASKGGKP